jgi:pyruvate kinase
MRKTKIICTIGPTSDNEDVLREIIKKGMNAARLNFSHGDYEEHGRRIDIVKKLRKEIFAPIAIILDTKGPEIRIGNFTNKEIELIEGQEFTITTRDIEGDHSIVSVSYDALHKDVKVGGAILINDGLLALRVESIEDKDIHCRVLNNAVISNHKNVCVPNVSIDLPAVTEKDISDIRFGIEKGIDMIAASFVRKASDVVEIRRVLEKYGGESILVISKIENHEGVENIDEIIKYSDAIMVARGDLGVQMPTEDIPIIQKMIIHKCNKAGKPVITATQMLDSMIRNPRPTRAEASDVANAIFDGTDAIMLSGETASGKYPVETVTVMAKIAEKAEGALDFEGLIQKRRMHQSITVPDAVCFAAVTTAMELNASAIITATQSGLSARMMSKYRPKAQIVATTQEWRVARKLSIVWGVSPIIVEKMVSTDEVILKSVEQAATQGVVRKGDMVIIAAGIPIGYAGTTNFMKIHIVGDVLVKGIGIGTAAYGNTCVVKNPEEAKKFITRGDILVIKDLNKGYIEFLDRVSGIIAEESGRTSDLTVECINMGIPIISGAEGATDVIKSGTFITMHTRLGTVYTGMANVL